MHVALKKMDTEKMQPKLVLGLQSVFVSLLLLPVKWIKTLFCGVLHAKDGVTMHCIATALR